MRWIARCAAAVAILTAGQAVGDAAQAAASETIAPRASVEVTRMGAPSSSDVGSANRDTNCRGVVVVAEFDYSLYGTVATVSGDGGATRFLFAGEYLDPSGDYYLRNRVYDPASASFLSVDPALAATGMPFAYTAGNPLQATDPLGLNWLSDTLTSPAFWGSTVVFLGCELATGGTGSVLCLAGAGAVFGALDYVESTPEECRTMSGLFTHMGVGAVTGVVGGRLFGPAASKLLGAAGRSVLKIVPSFVRESLGGVAEAASTRLSAFTEAAQQRTGNLFAQARAALAADTGPAFFRGAKPGEVPSFAPKSGEFKVDPQTGLVRDTHGVSVYDNPGSVTSRGLDPYLVDSTSIPPELRVIQRGVDPFHYEIVPRPGANLTPEEFTSCLFQIQCGR